MADTIINEGNGTFKTEGAVAMKELRDFLTGKDGLSASSFESANPGSISLRKLYDASSVGGITLADSAAYPSEKYSLAGFRGSSYRNPTISHTLTGGLEEFTITISASNSISTDKWQYKIGDGSWETGGAIGTTTKTVTDVDEGTLSVNVRMLNASDIEIAISTAKDVVVESPYQITTTTDNYDSSQTTNNYKSRLKLNHVCGKGIPTSHSWACVQLYYNLPSAEFAGVTKASVLVDWNSTDGWNNTTSESTNKYLHGCPTSDADTGYKLSPEEGGYNTCTHCHSNPPVDTMSYLPPSDLSRYRMYKGGGALVWGNSDVTNSNAPTSTFAAEAEYQGSPGHYNRVGFVYSPGGYAWRNGTGGIGEMIYAFYDPNNTRVTIQYTIGSYILNPFNSYADSWLNVMDGATITVIAGGRNTNCPDVVNSGNGWDAS